MRITKHNKAIVGRHCMKKEGWLQFWNNGMLIAEFAAHTSEQYNTIRAYWTRGLISSEKLQSMIAKVCVG